MSSIRTTRPDSVSFLLVQLGCLVEGVDRVVLPTSPTQHLTEVSMNCSATVEVVRRFSEVECLLGKEYRGFEVLVGGGDHGSHRSPQSLGTQVVGRGHQLASPRPLVRLDDLPLQPEGFREVARLRCERPGHLQASEVIAYRAQDHLCRLCVAREKLDVSTHPIAAGDAGELSEVPEEGPGRFEHRSRSFEIAALREQAAEKGVDVGLPRSVRGLIL